MATGSLEILLRVNDRAFNSALSGISRNVQNVGKSFAGWNQAMRIAVNGLSQLAAKSVQLLQIYDEQARAQVRLQQVLFSTGEAAGFTYNQLDKMADSIQETTTIADKTAIDAMSRLAFFTEVTGNEFERATVLAADLSQFLGSSMQSEALRLGRALNDTASGIDLMTQAGISFTKEQKDMIKGLDEAGEKVLAQQYLLGLLEMRTGGVADAMADAASGPLRQLVIESENLQEAMGVAVAEGMEPLIEEATTLAKELASDEEFMQALTDATLAFSEAVIPAVKNLAQMVKWSAQLADSPLATGLYYTSGIGIVLETNNQLDKMFGKQRQIKEEKEETSKLTDEEKKKQRELNESVLAFREIEAKAVLKRLELEKQTTKALEEGTAAHEKRIENLRRSAKFEEDEAKAAKLLQMRETLIKRIADIEQNELYAQRVKEELELQEYSMFLWEKGHREKLDKLRDEAEKRKKLEKEIANFRESMRTPSEELLAEATKIYSWVRRGLLDASTAMRWVEQQRKDLRSDAGFTASFVGLQDLNKQIQAAAASDNPLLSENKKQTKELVESRRILGNMEKALKEPRPARAG